MSLIDDFEKECKEWLVEDNYEEYVLIMRTKIMLDAVAVVTNAKSGALFNTFTIFNLTNHLISTLNASKTGETIPEMEKKEFFQLFRSINDRMIDAFKKPEQRNSTYA